MTQTPTSPSSPTTPPPAGSAGTTRVGLPPLIVGAMVIVGFLLAALVFAGLTRAMGRRVVREKKPSAPVSVPKTVVEVAPEPGLTGPAASQPAPAPKDLPALSLSGVLFSENGDSYALINGKVVREGTAISGVTLTKVLPDRVELDFEGRRVTMRSM